MKAKNASWPRVVKNGTSVVRIYKTSSRGYPLFQASDFSQGSRRLRSFADEGEALSEAARIARLIANGQTTAGAFSPAGTGQRSRLWNPPSRRDFTEEMLPE